MVFASLLEIRWDETLQELGKKRVVSSRTEEATGLDVLKYRFDPGVISSVSQTAE